MKKILLIITIILVSSCSDKLDSEIFYLQENVIIRQSNESEGFTQDKFHRPMVAGKWLVESVEHPGKFIEMSTVDYGITNITKENWYSKQKGDTLHFDFIRKDHFFKIIKK